MTQRMKMILGGIVMAVTLAAVAVGLEFTYQAGARQEAARGAERIRVADATEAKIMEIVLKRNPDAPYRDFVDFPRILLSESKAAGIDFRLIMAQIDKESEFNPRAVGKAGEIGLMQVKPATGVLVAKALGIPFTGPSGKDLGTLAVPKYNLRIGIRFLKDRMDEFGALDVALRGYNRGPSAAREHRPADRYAEDIALKYMMFVTAFERGGPLSAVEQTQPKPKPVASVMPTLVPEPTVQVKAAGYHTAYTLSHVKSMNKGARTVRASYVVRP